MTTTPFTQLDDAICLFLKTRDGHPTDSEELCAMAQTLTGGIPWRLVDRRMQAMRKVGRIRYRCRKGGIFWEPTP